MLGQPTWAPSGAKPGWPIIGKPTWAPAGAHLGWPIIRKPRSAQNGSTMHMNLILSELYWPNLKNED